jgi:hypothetical protein
VRDQTIILDPDSAREAVLEGLASIEGGEPVELRGDAELKEFSDEVVSRKKRRLAATRRAAGG